MPPSCGRSDAAVDRSELLGVAVGVPADALPHPARTPIMSMAIVTRQVGLETQDLRRCAAIRPASARGLDTWSQPPRRFGLIPGSIYRPTLVGAKRPHSASDS